MSTEVRYIVGQTVNLSVRVSGPDSDQPVTPDSVVLETLSRAGVTVPTSAEFVEIDPGLYRAAVLTAGFTPGTYRWRVRVSDGPEATTLAEDTFVLVAASS